MPYLTEGGLQFTDHHIQSPLNNIANSCQVCHREETERLINDVYSRQDKIVENHNTLEILLVRCHIEAKTAWDKGSNRRADEADLVRHKAWTMEMGLFSSRTWEFIPFPVETGRIIATGIALASDARVKLARLLASLGYNQEVPYPDIETKGKAPVFIGLDMVKLNAEKKVFLETIIPEWIKKGLDRESKY